MKTSPRDPNMKLNLSLPQEPETNCCKNNFYDRNKSAYEYTEEKPPEPIPKRNREEDGRVKVKLRNTQTNPGSKVIDSYFKPLKHMDDPYERAHQLKLEQQRRDQSLEG